MDVREILKNYGIELVEGSHLDNVAQALNEAGSTLFSEWEPDLSAYDVDNLSGSDLDKLGGFFNMSRRIAIEAVDFTGLNLKLTNIGSTTFSIPSGFKVYSDKMEYVTTNTIPIELAPGKWTTVPFQATSPGSIGNAAIGEINRCDYPDNIEVYNLAPVISGADVESDDSYRYRLSKIRTIRTGGTIEAIDATIRALPFIADVDVIRGNIPGTVEVHISPVYGSMFAGLRDIINNVMESYLAAGDVLLIYLPIYKVIKMDINLEVTKGQDFDTIADLVKNTAINIILGYRSNSLFEIKSFLSELDSTLSGYPRLYRFLQMNSVVVYDIDEGGQLINPIPIQKQYLLGSDTLFTTNATYINVS